MTIETLDVYLFLLGLLEHNRHLVSIHDLSSGSHRQATGLLKSRGGKKTEYHLAVENRLNFRCDATDGERIGAASVSRKSAQMLAGLNSVLLSLMDLHHVPNVARQRRRFASHPYEALAWVY